MFGLEHGHGLLLARLIFEQLIQVEPVRERVPKAHEEDPTKLTRRFTLDIPRFRGPNGNVAAVRTNWALDPGEQEPHLSTAFPVRFGIRMRNGLECLYATKVSVRR